MSQNRRHDITVYCGPCNRNVEINEEDLPKGGRPIGYRMVCRECGGRGKVIVSPADHHPNNQMMGPVFYGEVTRCSAPEPIKKRRSRKR